MAWSKTKQQLESFLCPALIGCVEYRASSYRYSPDKSGHCYITVNKQEIFRMNDKNNCITWYQNEQEIKANPDLYLPINEDDIALICKESKGTIPEERLKIIAKNRKLSTYAKKVMNAQMTLSKSDFYKTASTFLTSSVDQSLQSDDILLNVFAICDRRVGKKRLQNMHDEMLMKHPAVQYFYRLRLES